MFFAGLPFFYGLCGRPRPVSEHHRNRNYVIISESTAGLFGLLRRIQLFRKEFFVGRLLPYPNGAR